MRDIQRRDTGDGNRILDRLQHVDLRRDIQRRGGLVKDHKIRLGAQRQRRHAALQLSARHLVRIAVADGFGVGQTQRLEQLDRAGFSLFLAELALADRRFGHLFHDLLGRVEGRRRRLRHIGHLGPAQTTDVAVLGLQQVAPVHPDLAAGQFDAAPAIGQRGQSDGGLARTGFPDQPQNLTRFQVEIDPMDDLDIMRLFARRIDRCTDFQAADFYQWIAHPRPPFSEVVRFRTQSATRLTLMASVAMATAG